MIITYQVYFWALDSSILDDEIGCHFLHTEARIMSLIHSSLQLFGRISCTEIVQNLANEANCIQGMAWNCMTYHSNM